MENGIVGAVFTFVAGVGVSFVNYLLSRTFMRRKPDAFPTVSVLRQTVNVAYLVAVYFIAPYTPWDRISLLVGAVLGSTLSLFVFTYLLVKNNNNKNV